MTFPCHLTEHRLPCLTGGVKWSLSGCPLADSTLTSPFLFALAQSLMGMCSQILPVACSSKPFSSRPVLLNLWVLASFGVAGGGGVFNNPFTGVSEDGWKTQIFTYGS